MKTTKDNFIFKIVTEQAKEIFNSGLFELFALYEDDTEAKIETLEQLTESLEKGLEIAIEVGCFQPHASNQPIFWSTEDFEARAESNFNDLKVENPDEFAEFETWEQLYDKTKFPFELQKMIGAHDCNIGITWETVDTYIGNCEIKN